MNSLVGLKIALHPSFVEMEARKLFLLLPNYLQTTYCFKLFLISVKESFHLFAILQQC